MLQVEVAAEIGVTESTVWNWEHGTRAGVDSCSCGSRVLGYVPWECPDDPVGRLAYFKKIKGLSLQATWGIYGEGP